jgi:hypothetical protein
LPFDPFEQSAACIAPFNPKVVELDLAVGGLPAMARAAGQTWR